MEGFDNLRNRKGHSDTEFFKMKEEYDRFEKERTVFYKRQHDLLLYEEERLKIKKRCMRDMKEDKGKIPLRLAGAQGKQS